MALHGPVGLPFLSLLLRGFLRLGDKAVVSDRGGLLGVLPAISPWAGRVNSQGALNRNRYSGLDDLVTCPCCIAVGSERREFRDFAGCVAVFGEGEQPELGAVRW